MAFLEFHTAIKLSRPAATIDPSPSVSSSLAVPVNLVKSKVFSFLLSLLFIFFHTVIFYCHTDSRHDPPPFPVCSSAPCKSFRRQINLGLDHRLGHSDAYSSTACFPHELSATARCGDYSTTSPSSYVPPPKPPHTPVLISSPEPSFPAKVTAIFVILRNESWGCRKKSRS